MPDLPPNKGWTFETLERYLSSKIDSLRDNVALALTNAEKAVTKAEGSVDRRLEGMNEIRGALADQASTLLSRAEYGSQHQALVEKVDDLAKRLATLEDVTRGKSASLGLVGSIVAGVIAAVVAVGVLVLDTINSFRHTP